MHGIDNDMNFWTLNEPSKTPAFLLAEQGYDVWLGNNRGSRYGKGHLTLDYKTDADYWRFSVEEYGLKDLPAFIDHILAKTGQEKLTYIGHSQGTTAMFLGAALNPEYFEQKVNLFVALGPITVLKNIRVPSLKKMAPKWAPIEFFANKVGAWNLFDANWVDEQGA